MIDYEKELNPAQAEAVLYDDGPALVIAGAGSGKTRVLTYKLAHLLEEGYDPHKLMALTFTNKAAREMLSRVESMVGSRDTFRMKLGTFHSVFSRYLRIYAPLLGFTPNFSIYDTSDSKSLVKRIVKDMALDPKFYTPKLVLGRISHCKNNLITPEGYAAGGEYAEYDYRRGVPMLHSLYAAYVAQCRQANAMDFDDLLYYFNILLRDHPEVQAECAASVDYLLIDEYQDTNPSQYLIARRLVEAKQRIFAVGDDAQSIYSFRGASMQNILTFTHTFPSARLFKLEENYRSSQRIVALANSLIEHNVHRIKKEVFSNRAKGEKIDLYEMESGYREAQHVVESIYKRYCKHSDTSYGSFAILYRTNAQSRLFEDQLRQAGIPYRIYGGIAFYSRAEIKNVLAYLQLIANPHNNEAFERAAKYPRKGIGDKTLSLIRAEAAESKTSLFAAAESLIARPDALPSSARTKLTAYLELIRDITYNPEAKTLVEWVQSILLRSQILDTLRADTSIEGHTQLENVNEFVSGVQEFEDETSADGLFFERGETASLHDLLVLFLQGVTLITDNLETGENADAVHLMTIHAAKGLEFDHVYIVGLEEGLFPSMLSAEEENIEEERRLLYVAITRAKEYCSISFARYRAINGMTEYMIPSRFLRDLDMKYLNLHNCSADLKFTSRSNDFSPLSSWESSKNRHGELGLDFEDITAINLSSSQGEKIPFSKKKESSFAPSLQGASGSKRAIPIPYSQRKAPKGTPKGTVDFSVGDIVQHPTFGRGVVTSVLDKGENSKIQVNFDTAGEKTILIRFASLKKLAD
ncbi:ATP-dependent helicase [Porphyromonas endodontalis]|jgi:ATP-dependent DNA helicase pcrA|uniref:ATP-dependent helicase n=1 Tax=Porphyromonas endodontalis TaxID=28124 RepID=UPI0028F02D47|nr:UvrD-helicase domain-containing protein [Porphyromonas endodontalis]